MKTFFLIVFFCFVFGLYPRILGKSRFFSDFAMETLFFLVFTQESVKFCTCFSMKTFVFWSSLTNSREQIFCAPLKNCLCPPPHPPVTLLWRRACHTLGPQPLKSSSCRDPTEKYINFLFFWSSPTNLRTKSVLKEDNIGFGAKYLPDWCCIPNASGLGCVSIPSKVLCPPKHTILAPGLLLYCFTCSARTIMWSVTT